MNKSFLIYIAIFILLQNSLAQQRLISGLKIEKKTTWTGNIIVEGDVTVTKQGRLIIEAGTNILFKPNMDLQRSGKDKTRSELIVFGIIMVKGQLDRKVTFSSASNEPRMGDWYGIRLMSPNKISVLDNCIVQYAFNGITIKRSNPIIRNSQMTLNYHAGILALVKAEPIISKNIISENGYAGVITRLGAKPILSDNLIAANQIGIIAFSLSQPNLGNLNDPKRINQGRNNIFENSEYDVYNHTNLPLLAENNSWGDNNNQRNIAARIYDSVDEAKYGVIDFLPLFRKSNLNALFQISQASPTSVFPDPLLSTIDSTNLNQYNNLLSDTTLIANRIVSSTPPITQNRTQQNTNIEPERPVKIEESSAKKRNALAVNNTKPDNNLGKKSTSPSIDYNQIFYEFFTDSKKGKVIKTAAPQITNSAFGRGAKGRIRVRAIVGKNGNVESASVIQGLNDYYDKISREAALKFKYKPGIIQGRPVRFYTTIIFEF